MNLFGEEDEWSILGMFLFEWLYLYQLVPSITIISKKWNLRDKTRELVQLLNGGGGDVC